MTPYETYIAKSRYARFLDNEGRREHWPETVQRYVNFMQKHLKTKHNYDIAPTLLSRMKEAITNREVLPCAPPSCAPLPQPYAAPCARPPHLPALANLWRLDGAVVRCGSTIAN